MTQPPDPASEQTRAQRAPLPAAPPVTAAELATPAYQDLLTLPTGVELASAGRRIGAYFLTFPLFIFTLGVGYVIWGLIVWGRGQTPALQVLGMRCWRPDDGRVANWGWMALREIVGRLLESIVSIIALISLILMLARQNRQSLHDLIAGTVVVYDPGKVLARNDG